MSPFAVLRVLPWGVLVVAVVIVTVVALEQSALTGTLQVALMLVGIAMSYLVGHGGDVRPHARKAYRRAANLWSQIYALTSRIAELGDTLDETPDGRIGERARDHLRAVGFEVAQYLGIVEGLMEDWADVVPDEADELRETLKRAEQEDDTREHGTRMWVEITPESPVEYEGGENEDGEPD